MRHSCELIKDLLPLYCDDVSSDYTNRVIEEHLEECENCRNLAAKMGNPRLQKTVSNVYMKALFKHEKKREIRRAQIIFGLILVAALMLIVGSRLPGRREPSGKTDHVEILHDASETFSEAEIAAAQEMILAVFKEFTDCDLRTLGYDDELTKKFAQSADSFGVASQDVMVFRSEFTTAIFGKPFALSGIQGKGEEAWNIYADIERNKRYGLCWYMVRVNGRWYVGDCYIETEEWYNGKL